MKYNISPFDPFSVIKGGPADKVSLQQYLDSRFTNWQYTEKARTAIQLALSYYNLSKNDVVTILTTSGNYYISSCVTNAIETICEWSREILPQTKILLVNHEFGYPYKNITSLKKYGLPIIEDCAYAFFSESKNNDIGKVGDFAIYSLPKAFPVEFGGILVSNRKTIKLKEAFRDEYKEDLIDTLSAAVHDVEKIKKARMCNYDYLVDVLKPLGIEPFFVLEQGVVPGVFLFKWRADIDYPALKIYMQENGVESSVFYGQNAFFIPMHHLLVEKDLQYFYNLLKNFL